VLGIDERELAAIFTVQTAGEALNYHPHLHGLLADGYWRDSVFTRFGELELKEIEEAFANRVLASITGTPQLFRSVEGLLPRLYKQLPLRFPE